MKKPLIVCENHPKSVSFCYILYHFPELRNPETLKPASPGAMKHAHCHSPFRCPPCEGGMIFSQPEPLRAEGRHARVPATSRPMPPSVLRLPCLFSLLLIPDPSRSHSPFTTPQFTLRPLDSASLRLCVKNHPCPWPSFAERASRAFPAIVSALSKRLCLMPLRCVLFYRYVRLKC